MASKNKGSKDNKSRRVPLSRVRVIEGAVALADQIGAEAVTIRRLAEAIDARPMTIYHHVPNKEAIVDGMVDHVYGKVTLPPLDVDWQSAMKVRCRSMRDVLNRHWWATPLMDSRRQTGTAMLQHFNAMLGVFLGADFSYELTGHAYAALDSFVYGFALQEASLPESGEMSELATSLAEEIPADQFPHLADFTVSRVMQPGYDFGDSFEVGLSLILDGLTEARNNGR